MALQRLRGVPGAENDILPVLVDVASAISLALWSDRSRLLRCFVFVPAGAFTILAACFGVNRLLSLGGVAFPASVACLILLFFGLLLCDYFAGEHRTKKLVRLINIPGGWSLRWLNLFFTPSFVMLPLSPAISAAEVGKIIAVFVLGFVAMMVFAAYMTRAIQLLHSPPRKAALHQRDAVTQPDSDAIPLLHPELHHSSQAPAPPPPSHAAAYITIRGQNLDDPLSSFSDVAVSHPAHIGFSRLSHQLPPQKQKQKQKQTQQPRKQNGKQTQLRQSQPAPPRAERWAGILAAHADAFLFGAALLLVGVPVYYAADYAMPLQLCINVLMFFGALAMPPSWRQFLHPVIVSAFATLLAIWLLGRVHSQSLADVLGVYRPGHSYLTLWSSPSSSARMRPGAGDVLASALDVSIVSLALPMFQYRLELRNHFWAIVLPNIVLSITSLFAYPVVCHAIGISPERSLAFTSRSLTLALATPAVRNLGGDLNTVAAIAIISGVLGVLIGPQILSWLRIPEDDYVTRGVTLGANASALATALLLRTDPRAAALSSLAMSLFGTVTVTFSSIPPMAHIIRSLVGLS